MDILQRIQEYCSENEDSLLEDTDMVQGVLELPNMYVLQKEGDFFVNEQDGEYQFGRVVRKIY